MAGKTRSTAMVERFKRGKSLGESYGVIIADSQAEGREVEEVRKRSGFQEREAS